MSLENAILELAAALRDQAGAVNAQVAASRELLASYNSRYANAAGDAVVAEVQKNSSKKEKAAEVKPDAELDQAVSKVEADAKKNVGAAEATKTDTAAASAGSATEPASSGEPLNYDKDVKPALLAFIKANSQEACRTLLTNQFGVARATDLKPEQYPAVLAAIKD
jgi:hypothetical protein